jgi:hypothetical protein
MPNPLLRDLSSLSAEPGDPEYRRFQFTIVDLLAVMAIVAFLGATTKLHSFPLQLISLLAVFYVVKFRLLTLRAEPWLTLLLHVILVAAVLPYLYYICDLAIWNDCDVVFPLVKWVGAPIMVFTIPTASFLWDVLYRRPSYFTFAFRSILEIILLIPLWLFLWFWTMALWGWFDVPQPK